MNSLELTTGIFDIARATTGLAANWLVQSTLLISAGLLIGHFLRGRGSAVQSAVYRTTLVAVLACPIATWSLSLAGISGWSLQMPAAYQHDESLADAVIDVVAPVDESAISQPAATLGNVDPPFDPLSLTANPSLDGRQDVLPSAPVDDQIAATPQQPPIVESVDPADFQAVDSPQAPVLTVNRFGFVAAAAGALWLFIAGLLACRLAIAWWKLHCLRRSAWSAEAATLGVCREIAALLNVKPPEVLHSPFLPSPCLAGLQRPAVLLPEAELSLPLREVFVHELAHLRRHDCWWNLLRRVVTALLFFQPLLWRLSIRLDSTAEEVCDDYVVQFGGDRHQYAQRLVDIAELSLAPAAAAGVGIVSLRSMLAARVARIMDTSRSLSTRVGHALLALVLLCGVIGTMLAGFVGITPAGHSETIDAAAPNDMEDQSETDIEGAAPAVPLDQTAEETDDVQTVRGRVIDDSGAPIPDARITATQFRWLDDQYVRTEHQQTAETRAGADGQFEVTVPKRPYPDFGKSRLQSFNWKPVTIMATASGYVPAWVGGEWIPTDNIEGPHTDDEGSFAVELPARGSYRIGVYSEQYGWSNLAKEIDVQPGETIDLGTIDITDDERPEMVRTAAAIETTDKREAKEQQADDVNHVTSSANGSAAPPAVTAARPSELIEYAGQVVTPEGKPAAGARVFLIYHFRDASELLVPNSTPLALADASGTFRVAINAAELRGSKSEWSRASIAAAADGYGFAWSLAAAYETSGTFLSEYRALLEKFPAPFRAAMEKQLAAAGQPLRLVPDSEPIRGQILDINGEPVRGAKLTLLEVWAGAEDDLTPWLNAAKEEKADYYSARMMTPRVMTGPHVRSLVTPAITDADGRFSLPGVGRERIAQLLVEGTGIETSKIFARTGEGEKIELLRERRSPDSGSFAYHPAEFSYVAGPSKPIVGVVKDRKTGRALADVTVKSQRRHGHAISGWREDFVRALTDSQGRYRLEGMPIGDDNTIAAIPPTDQCYLPTNMPADTSQRDVEIEVNFELQPGVWLEGRVTDKATDNGLAGWLQHFVYRDNPHLEGLRGIGLTDMRNRNVADDHGRFRIPILPGPGIVAFMAFDHEKYPRAAGAMSLRGATRADGHELIQDTHPYLLSPANFHIVSPVNPAADAGRVEVNLALDGSNNISGKLVDADGQPLNGTRYSGKLAQYGLWDRADGDSFEVVGYDPNQPRRLLFHHAERRLAGMYVLKGAPPDNFVVKLQPAGSVSGRLVDSDGDPLASMQLLHWTPAMSSPAEMAPNVDAIQPAGFPLPPNVEHNSSGQHETDAKGHFTIEGLVAGVEYRIRAFNVEARTVEQALMQRISGVLEKAIVVEPGQKLELGDVRLVEEGPLNAGAQNNNVQSTNGRKLRSAAQEPKQQTKLTGNESVEARGRVLRPDGQPAAGAELLFAPRHETVPEDLVVLATTDADGRFQFEFPKSHLKRLVEGLRSPWNSPYIVARMDGFGPVARQIVTPDDADEVTLQLVPDEVPIEGQIVDLEGRPVAGARLRVLRIEGNPDGTLDEWLTALRKFDEYWNNSGVWPRETIEQNITGLPATMRTDAKGQFSLRGMGRERVVHMRLEGPRLESMDIAAMSRPEGGLTVPFDKGEPTLGTFTVYNAKFTHTAAPSQPVQGVVRDAESGKPIPGITLYCEKQAGREIHGRYAPETTTDNEGRYLLDGLRKGADNQIAVVPPPGVPYAPQMVVMDTSQGLDTQTVDIKLQLAAVIRGRVTDEATGKPVARAHVEYFTAVTNTHLRDYPGLWDAADITTTTDEDGRYEIVGLPGRGFIAVRAASDEFASGQRIDVTSNDYEEYPAIRGILFRTHPRSCVAKEFHSVAAAEIGENQTEIERNIMLRRGVARRARVLDADGTPLAGVTVNRKGVYACEWYGGDTTLDDAEFTIYGLEEEKPRSVFLKHEGRQLVGAFLVRGDSDEPIEMRLEPAGSMVGRLVDEDGKPVGNTTLHGKLAKGQGDFDGYFFRSTTDDAGRFQLSALLPRLKYRLNYQEAANRYVDLKSEAIASHELSVESGKVLNLGDVRPFKAPAGAPTSSAETASQSAAAKQTTTSLASDADNRDNATNDRIKIRGRVLDPNGKPMAGARIFTPRIRDPEPWALDAFKQVERASSDDNGAFEFDVPDADLPHHFETVPVLAYAPGFGVAGGEVARDNRKRAGELALQLVQDKTVRGRVIDTEGRPIEGVKLQVTILMVPNEGELDTFLNGWRQNWMDAPHGILTRLKIAGAGDFGMATTNADGRFDLRGLGADRVAWLQISGGGIAQTVRFLVTRDGIDYDALNKATAERNAPAIAMAQQAVQLVGPTFEFIAEPAQTITGTVRSSDGKPIAGARVLAHVGWDSSVTDITDARGWYRLSGLRKGKAELIGARAPNDSAFMDNTRQVSEDDQDLLTENVDFVLPRGVVVTGRVVDRETGEGVPAGVRFAPLPGNQYFDKPGYDGFRHNRMTESADADGRFRIVTIPGPGMLLVQGHSQSIKLGDRYVNPYRLAQLTDADRDRLSIGGGSHDRHFQCADGSLEFISSQTAMKYLDNAPEGEPADIQIELDRGKTMEVIIEGPDGEPLNDAIVSGMTAMWPITFELIDSKCTLYALDPAEPREVIFFHAPRQLAAVRTVRGDEASPLSIRLEPTAVLAGRALDDDGEPIASTEIQWSYHSYAGRELTRFLQQQVPPVHTNADGRFEIRGVLPELDGRLILQHGRMPRYSDRITAPAPGETRTLGDVVVKARN